MSDLESTVAALAVALLLSSSFLALAETSLSRIDMYQAKALAEDGRRGSSTLLRLISTPERFAGYLNSILLMSTSSQIVGSTAAAYLLLKWFSGWAFVLGVFIEIGVVYVIAEALPKTIAIQHTRRAALLTAPLVGLVARTPPMRLITRPLIFLARSLAPGGGLREGPFVYEQQILALADSAAASKSMEPEEHELIHSVIEFGTTIAREVMVPRTDMISVAEGSTADQAIDTAIAKGFSRFPVYKDDSGDITGVIFTKDLMRVNREGDGTKLVADLRREAKFIPETKRVSELMKEMQLEKVHMAIVLDEHGTVVGLVTLEDLIEEVVGDINDEYDDDVQPHFEKLGESEWRVDARMSIDEVNGELGIHLPEGDWDTIGGLLIDAFERVPNRAESIEIGTYRIWVEQISGRRVTRVRVRDTEDRIPVSLDDVKDGAAR
jgi:putative hemolysin